MAVVRLGPKRWRAFHADLLRDGTHGGPVATVRVARQPASPRYVRPPWASDRAHDSATASDTTGHWPGHRPPPCWVPAYAPPVPHGRDDRYGTAGTAQKMPRIPQHVVGRGAADHKVHFHATG